jgi:hypothetical protein
LRPPIDPRRGDVEDDASSSKRRSLLSLAGSLLAEISLPKLVVAWTLLIGLPGLMLGVAPIVASIWLGKISDKVATALAGTWSAILLVALLALGWFGGRRVFQLAEKSFWSLNSLTVQPCYVVCREVLRHLAGRLLPHAARNARLHRTTAVAAGVLICAMSLLAVTLVWPSAHFASDFAILTEPKRLAIAALANTVVLVGAYVAAAALIWAFADAALDPPRNLDALDAPSPGSRTWRIAHLSDVHVVGERYGFRSRAAAPGRAAMSGLSASSPSWTSSMRYRRWTRSWSPAI